MIRCYSIRYEKSLHFFTHSDILDMLRRLLELEGRGIVMDYKNKIVRLLEQITDENKLRLIYKIVKAMTR